MRPFLFASLLSTLLLAAAPTSLAQTLWTDVAASSLQTTLGASDITATTSRTVRLDVSQMETRLGSAPLATDLVATPTDLRFPLPGGGFADVRVTEASILAPALQAKYPAIRTYLADGDGSITGRLSMTPAGFRGMLFTPEGTVFVDPYVLGETVTYVVYYGRDQLVDPALRGRIADEVIGESSAPQRRGPNASRSHGETLRTYRLAVAATGEYTAFHGGTVAGGLAAIVTTINRVTGIYERDLSVSFQLVANNDQIVYTNASTDPYANTSGDLNANRDNINAVIGFSNYDVGHLVGTGGGGVAQLGVICGTNKARGLTGSGQPIGDAFDVDYVAHELGHQFAGNHTFNGDSGACSGLNRNGSTAYEPGSGSTIQAYAGICGNDNLQSNSDAYFHGLSLDEMTTHVTTGSGGSCGTTAATGNTVPTVTVPGPFTIPAGTPFSLTGGATDDTRSSVTFAWEEFDLGPQADVNAGTVPFFRTFLPTVDSTRTFPQFDRLVAGQSPVIGETLPTGNRTLTFRLTARDNRAGGGGINDATTTVTLVDTGAPFAVTFALTSGQSYGNSAAVTWTVAGTDAGAINTPNVDILFSDDGGATFDYVLAAGVPNDGSQVVTFPVTTSQGRILVRGSGNVFFNVNAASFSTTAGAPPILAVSPNSVSATIPTDATTTRDVTVSNTAAAGAGDLTVAATIANLTAPGGPSASRSLTPAQARIAAVQARSAAPRPRGDTGADGTGAASLTGGPDAFGYTFTDSDEAGGPAVAFQDISGSGTAATLTSTGGFPAGDEGYADIAIPFAFPFYGADQSTVRVFSNGFATFSTLTGSTFNNGAIPATTTPNALLAPFWDDLDLGSTGTVHTGTAPDGRFAIQWTAAPRYNEAGSSLTFQILLAADGSIEYQYGTMTGTLNSATVGIENATGDDGLAAVVNAAYVASDKAIRFSFVPPAPPWATVAPASLTVAPGASDDLVVTFDSDGLADGVYTGDLVLASNDPAQSSVTVPMTLTVGGGTAAAEFTITTAGAYLLAPPVDGFTVDDLAAFNLVIGVPGYNDATNRNLLSEVDGNARFTEGAGTGDVLPLGRGFRWIVSGIDRDYGSGSISRPFPTTLTEASPNTADVTLDLQTAQRAINIYGNPFGTPLDISGIATWPNGTKISRNVFTWEVATKRWVYDAGLTEIAPWQAFFVRTRPGRTGTVTIPASAAVGSAAWIAARENASPTADDVGVLRFDLDGTALDGAPLSDGAFALTVGDDAEAEPKLAPLSNAYVSASFTSADGLRAIEALRADGGSVELPVAIQTVGAERDLVLRWDAPTALPAAWRVTLVDNVTGATADLAAAGAYAFEAESAPTADAVPDGVGVLAADGSSRFVLRIDTGDGAFASKESFELALATPFPNPTGARAQIAFTLAEAGAARLSVYDALGRQVAVLADGERAEGDHAVTFDARSLATGLYVIRLEAGGQVLTQRATIVR